MPYNLREKIFRLTLASPSINPGSATADIMHKLLKIAEKKYTLKNVTDHIADVICKRSEVGYNFGVILIPEGLLDFIAEVARIAPEKMLIRMVETELERRKQAGAYFNNFQGRSHSFGYEGRCCWPSNFDSVYCYALGYAAGALLHSGKTGFITSVGNLAAEVEEWTVGGTTLTSLMDLERRHGKFKPVVKKAMVELDGAPFKKFKSLREEWAINNRYISPGPIQYVGPASGQLSHTLLLELGVYAYDA